MPSGTKMVKAGKSTHMVGESRSSEISRLGKGEFFGEMSMFNDRPRTASALAYEDTKVFGFFQPDQDAEEGRLAGAIGPDQPDFFARVDREGDIVQDGL